MALRFTVAASAATIVLFLALHVSQSGGGGGVDAIAPQDKVKNFTRRYVTPFLTDDQLYQVANGYFSLFLPFPVAIQISKLIAQGMYAESPQDVIYSGGSFSSPRTTQFSLPTIFTRQDCTRT